MKKKLTNQRWDWGAIILLAAMDPSVRVLTSLIKFLKDSILLVLEKVKLPLKWDRKWSVCADFNGGYGGEVHQ